MTNFFKGIAGNFEDLDNQAVIWDQIDSIRNILTLSECINNFIKELDERIQSFFMQRIGLTLSHTMDLMYGEWE